MYRVTIDTGTTNTRVTVWQDKKAIHTEKREIGVRITSIEGTNRKLTAAVRECLEAALRICRITEQEVETIIASGMISSELGLCEIPRATAPVCAEKLAGLCVKKDIPEVSMLHPVFFIPGVQNQVAEVEAENCSSMDIMRGEEVETFGLLSREKIKGPVVLVLPGSHTKYVYVNEKDEIQGCTTTMAGEILMELTRSSILSSSLQAGYVEEIEERWLRAGAAAAAREGLNRCAFSVRILDLFSGCTRSQRANYLLGAVIETDLQALFHSPVYEMTQDSTVLIGGDSAYARGFAVLLREREGFRGTIRFAEKENQENVAGYGAIGIMEKRMTQ
ncbi:2-dehydro-3-deoxygalactonokinase [Diplocloster hominis]|uniref:2-dehydro-3-deoxygalactonokinase n=1 Tax=Diplocloster hominis TaxID=3079010 RepID=UPI0031BB580C